MQTKETKICNKCGRDLPADKFRLVKGQFHNPYYLKQCKECEYKFKREYLMRNNEIVFSDNMELLVDIKYKNIIPQRILDTSNLNIDLLGVDEIFVKLMDYKDTWLSNYGRIVRLTNNQNKLLEGSYDSNNQLKYSVMKNVYYNGKWTYKNHTLYAAKAVVETFIVNPDKQNNNYIWHSGGNKQDCYYKNLYPLNQEQYRIIKNHFNETEDDSKEFILKVINDIKYKPDNWSSRSMKPTMCGIGYHGSEEINYQSKAYLRWHDMMNRCYNEKFHERQSQYKGFTVCEEWHNFRNFEIWYIENTYGNESLDLDKDILFKGNTVYSPETCCLVPHFINTLFVNTRNGRGDYPVGVFFDIDKEKYRAAMSFMGRQIKLGTFDTDKEAFARYKEYKEDFIQDIAEQNRGKIPFKVYEAMMNWKIEITD